MLYIRIELWPRGDQGSARLLGEAHIANVGGDNVTGEYDVKILKTGSEHLAWKRARVTNFPRLRLGAWDLLFRALAAAIGARNTIEPGEYAEQRAFNLATKKKGTPR